MELPKRADEAWCGGAVLDPRLLGRWQGQPEWEVRPRAPLQFLDSLATP